MSWVVVRLLFATILVSASRASALNPNFRAGYSAASAQLRAALLANYDRHVPPESERAGNFTEAGTDVHMSLRFFKVQAIRASEGAMELKVWLRMSWTDTRLSWEPADYGGITTTYLWADPTPTSGNSELWVPDVQPYNARSNIVESLDPAYAKVDSTGSIFLSRPGTLDVMCKFSGLVAFPFDRLKCSIEFGGWILSGGYQGLELSGDGYVFSEQESTSGSSYQQYTIEEGA